MATIRRFEDLQAWQKARELVREIYTACAHGRLNRDFGLKDQLCRAAVSAMSNIAEGFARPSDRDFTHFLDIAKALVNYIFDLALGSRLVFDPFDKDLCRLKCRNVVFWNLDGNVLFDVTTYFSGSFLNDETTKPTNIDILTFV